MGNGDKYIIQGKDFIPARHIVCPYSVTINAGPGNSNDRMAVKFFERRIPKGKTISDMIAKSERMYRTNLKSANRYPSTPYELQRLTWAAARLCASIEFRTMKIENKYCT